MQTLRLANFLSHNYHPASAALADYLSSQLNIPVAFEQEASFTQLRGDELQLANICGLALVMFENAHPGLIEPLVAPMIDDPRTGDQPVYFCDLVVRRDLPALGLKALHGLNFAYNETVSFSGYLAAQHGLAQHGLGWSLFGKLLRSGSHQQSLQMLAKGITDVAALDSHSLRVELTRRPELNQQLRVLEHFGPFPMPPLVMHQSLPDTLKQALCHALTQLMVTPETQPELHAAAVTGFAAVSSNDYVPIRDIARCHARSLHADDFCPG